jgi:hypothetical protein
MNHPALSATLIKTPGQDNGYFYLIKTDCGKFLNLRGPGAPKDGKEGDRGFVRYRSGPSWGLYFWQPV